MTKQRSAHLSTLSTDAADALRMEASAAAHCYYGSSPANRTATMEARLIRANRALYGER